MANERGGVKWNVKHAGVNPASQTPNVQVTMGKDVFGECAIDGIGSGREPSLSQQSKKLLIHLTSQNTAIYQEYSNRRFFLNLYWVRYILGSCSSRPDVEIDLCAEKSSISPYHGGILRGVTLECASGSSQKYNKANS